MHNIREVKPFFWLKIGQEFECYGDVFINYNYPKVCKCVKVAEDRAQEIDGVIFYVEPSDFVYVEKINQ